MTEMQIELAKLNGTLAELYSDEVVRRIRARYSLSEEFAILRQRDEKPEEFAAYNAFAEACKAEAKAYVYGAG